MYSELIHTRCRDGIDIRKGGVPVSGGSTGGFKVYACSPAIFDDGYADIPLIDDLRQSKQSYSDPEFMEDSYIYMVPDKGMRCLMNFHPRHYDSGNKAGDYPHRPGNYVNQMFIGSFSDIYPFETFRNAGVWDAQLRGEQYYYANAPENPEMRDLAGEEGVISIDRIADFISDGRKEILKEAIAFIVGQYAMTAEERKYLVILDRNAYRIELWIAAIELAFSRSMASGLPFATRLDRFASTNIYTVDLNGNYQTQINLQSNQQRRRWRAMIVGADERDRANASAVSCQANAPYAVLDGINKTITAESDTEHRYYECAISYDPEHFVFTEGFLGMIDTDTPCAEMTALFDAFELIERYMKSGSQADLTAGIRALSKFRIRESEYLKNLCVRISSDLENIIGRDTVTGFELIRWLTEVSALTGKTFVKIDVKELSRKCIREAYSRGEKKKAFEIATIYSETDLREAGALLLEEASNSNSGEYKNFALLTMVKKDPDLISTYEKLTDLLRVLNERGLEDRIPVVLSYKATFLESAEDIEKFTDWMQTEPLSGPEIPEPVLMQIGRVVDSAEGQKISKDLTGRMFGRRMTDSSLDIFVRIAGVSERFSRTLMDECIRNSGGRKNTIAGKIIDHAAGRGKGHLYDSLVTAAAGIRHADRSLKQLSRTVTTAAGQKFIADALVDAERFLSRKKDRFLLKRFFSNGENES